MSFQWKMHFDWLSITGKVSKNEGDPQEDFLLARVNLTRRILSGLGIKSPTLQTVQPARYYAVSLVDRQTGVRVNLGENLSSQGWQVVCDGKALAEFDVNGILRHFLEVWKGKVTRADFAIDLIWSGLSVIEFAEDYRREHGDDASRSFSLITSKTGETAYIGSRTSERMLRFYNKGKQQNVPIDWLRVELEAKGAHAQRLVETFLYDYVKVVAEIEAYIRTPDTALSVILRLLSAGEVAERVRSPRVVPDRLKWFNGQVLQAYFKLCEDDIEQAREVWEKFHETYMAYAVWSAFQKANDQIAKSLVQSEL